MPFLSANDWIVTLAFGSTVFSSSMSISAITSSIESRGDFPTLWSLRVLFWPDQVSPVWYWASLRKQTTFGDATNGFNSKLRLRNKRQASFRWETVFGVAKFRLFSQASFEHKVTPTKCLDAHSNQTKHRQSRVQGFFTFAGIAREKQEQTSQKKNKVPHWLPSKGAFPDPVFCFQNKYTLKKTNFASIRRYCTQYDCDRVSFTCGYCICVKLILTHILCSHWKSLWS